MAVTQSQYCLYMALHRRDRARADGAYHTDLFLLSLDEREAFCFRVMNRLRPLPAGPAEVWEFERKPLADSERRRIAALASLGPVALSSEQLAAALRAAPVVQGDARWTARTWTFGAIDNLVRQRVIAPPKTDLAALHTKQTAAADAFWARRAVEGDEARTPVIDTAGALFDWNA